MASTEAQAGLPQGFRVPAEESPHEATIMMWPASRRVYTGKSYLRLVQRTISKIANAIKDFEPVILLADANEHSRIRKLVSDDVVLWDIPTEDLWARDAGPLIATASNGRRVHSHIRFNGWGKKQVHKFDGAVAKSVTDRLGFDTYDSGLRGECGGADQDGHGNLIAHESSWVIANRNPGLSQAEIERRLLSAYGARHLVWSEGLKARDVTDYHIDGLARFTGPGRVLMNLPKRPDARDPFHKAANRTHKDLTDAGLTLDIIPDPTHRRVKSIDFVASYVNYYVCNGAVIMPHFGDSDSDQIAQSALARHYPGREIIALNTDPLGENGGGIHCATQQLPA